MQQVNLKYLKYYVDSLWMCVTTEGMQECAGAYVLST